MATPVIMPKLGLTMTEGTIVRWLKPDGASVTKGEPVVEILTDKANMEVEAPGTGRLQIVAAEGAVLPILEVIGQVLGEGEAPTPVAGSSAAPGETAAHATAAPAAAVPASAEPAPASAVSEAGGRLRISPAARRLARELGVAEAALAGLSGTGPGGRIVLEDVRRASASLATAKAPAATPAAVAAAPKAVAAEPAAQAVPVASPAAAAGEVRVIPLTGVRGIIAERLTRSVREAPQFHVSTDIVMDQLVALRDELQPLFESSYRVKLSYTDLLVKAVARALESFPVLNSFVSSEAISVQPQVHLGVAVGAEQGLVVPVIRDAGVRSLAEVSADLKRLAASARRGSLSLDDLSGGTFTLSNLGMYGVTSFAAIVNPPQAGILAVGALREELRPEGRGLAIRRVTSFTVTCDHRAVDGVMAAQFLGRLKEIIEGPELREVCRP